MEKQGAIRARNGFHNPSARKRDLIFKPTVGEAASTLGIVSAVAATPDVGDDKCTSAL